ncbi:hypothetical protein [Marivivens donghaensis]|uniref:hypothetical protein n=1 Tax=Marivivens donghaensis TaxID=1699413 RepID=UPI003F6981FD
MTDPETIARTDYKLEIAERLAILTEDRVETKELRAQAVREVAARVGSGRENKCERSIMQ